MSKTPSPQEPVWPDGAIFTVGHSTMAIARFVALLHIYGIKCLADIRTVPRSRRNPQFNGDALGGTLKAEKIEYVAIPPLGGLRHARKDSSNTGWRNASFRGYADYMQTEAFEDGLATLIELSRQQRTAMMRAEAVPWRCHRSLVADALSVRGVPSVEILSESSYRVHKLNPFARVEGTQCAVVVLPPVMGLLEESIDEDLDRIGHGMCRSFDFFRIAVHRLGQFDLVLG
jgi:uncharacterized protein (DUF488 family)